MILSTMTATSSTGAGQSESRPSTPVTPDNQPSSLPHYYEMREKETVPQRINQAHDGYAEHVDGLRPY
jgi:hypothetical protein